MKSRQTENLLYSAAGIAIMLVIMVAVNIIASAGKVRVDLTEEKIYTLSDGTKAILNELDTPVTIRFYCTQDPNVMPVSLKTYAQDVEDLLEEFEQASGGQIRVEKLDPEPDSDEEESALLDGVQGQMVDLNTQIYMGISVSSLDQKQSIPFLSPSRQRLLEYDLARAVSQVMTVDKPSIGVMSSLPVGGGGMDPMMMQRGQMQQQEAWVFYDELQKDFDVQTVDTGVESIDESIDVLIVVHPKEFSEATEYAIDQFVLRGGKLIAFMDPLCIMDPGGPQNNPMQRAMSSGSKFNKLLGAWGVDMDDNKVVADMNFVTQVGSGRGGGSAPNPAVLSITEEGVNEDDIVTSQIDSLVMAFAGAFTGDAAEGLNKEILVHTTAKSQMVEKMMAQFSGQNLVNDFKSEGKEYPLALRLTGSFKTAFPNGKPSAPAGEEEANEEETEESANGHLAESGEKGGVVVLVADVDMVADQFSVQVQNFLGNRILRQLNGNLNLVQGLTEQMAGDSNLIAVRSRATLNRPFTVVKTIQAEAEERYRTKIQELEEELQTAQTRLNELQRQKQGDQRFIISPEQQQEIENFQQRRVEVRKELREVRKNLKKDVDALENKLTFLNIAGVPILVILFGVALAVIKRKKTSAK